MRLKGNASTEFRFELIIKLSKDGRGQSAIAELVNCSQSWVSRVLKRHSELGDPGLKVKVNLQKRPPRLSQEQLAALPGLLLQGALAHGFETGNWTRERIAELIARQFGESYHPSHMSKLMKKIGFTVQKPMTRSYRKDDQSVREWRDRQLPQLKKSG